MCSAGTGIIFLKCKPSVAWHEGQLNGLLNFIDVLLCFKFTMDDNQSLSYYEMKCHPRRSLLVVGLSAGRQSAWYHTASRGVFRLAFSGHRGSVQSGILEDYFSLKTILLQLVTFQCEWGWHHRKRAWRCTDVNGSRRKGRRDLSQRRCKIRTESSVKRNENELSLLHTKASNAVMLPLQGKLTAQACGARGLRWPGPRSGPD